jgi:hypothetical protein
MICAIPIYLARKPLSESLQSVSRSLKLLYSDARNELRRIKAEPLRVQLALGFIIFCGVLLRLNYIQGPMSFDESWTFMSFVQMPAVYIPLRFDAFNNHILHTLLVKSSTALFGDAEWAIRLPAFAFGVAVLPASFLFFRKVYGTGAGLIGLSLVATSSPLIEYSVSARGYSMVMFAFLSILLLGDYALRHRSAAAWTLMAAIGALAVFTVPIMLQASAMVWSWLALRATFDESRAPRLKTVAELIVAGLALMGLSLFLYAPVFAVNGLDVLRNTMRSAMTKGTAAEFVWTLLANWHRDFAPTFSVAIVFGLGVAIIFHQVLSGSRVPLLLLAPLIFVIHALTIHDFGFRRSWLFVLPVYLATAAAGLNFTLAKAATDFPRKDSHAGQTLAAVLAIVLCAASAMVLFTSRSVIASSEGGRFRDAKLAIHIVRERAQDGDLVAGHRYSGAMQLAYYAMRSGLRLAPLGDFSEMRVFAISGTGRHPRTDGERQIFFANNFVPTNVESMTAGVPPNYRLRSLPENLHRSGEMEIYSAAIQETGRD